MTRERFYKAMQKSRIFATRVGAFFLFLALVFSVSIFGIATKASGEDNSTKNLSAIVDKDKTYVDKRSSIASNGYAGTMYFALLHDPEKNGLSIKDGDSVNIGLIAKDPNLNFLRLSNKFDDVKTVKDSASGQLLADVRNSNNIIYFTFKDIDLPFKAKGEVSLYVSSYNAKKYFEEHPEKEQVEFSYEIQINGVPTGKIYNFVLKKEKPTLPSSFDPEKSAGGYSEDKDKDAPGRGTIYYEIHASSKLRQNNEIVIYDMPDVNLALDWNKGVTVYFAAQPGSKAGNSVYIFNQGKANEKCRSYAGDADCALYNFKEENTDPDKTTEMFFYDVYYVTEKPVSKVASRLPGFEEKSLIFPRKNVVDNSQEVKSQGMVVAPKDILLEKPAGSELTEVEKQKIAAAGGLHKTVGKGFKLRIKNHRNAAFPAGGGNIVLAFNMRVMNDSLELSDKGNPLYHNTFSYYGQEIPNCLPTDENCTPIKVERTDPKMVKGKTVKAELSVPQITAETDKYQSLNFTKKNAQGEPLAGAKFSIYKATKEGERGELAETKDGVKLENLVTNADGKLCLAGKSTPLDIKILRGNYVLVEIEAPKGYQLPKESDTLISVQVAKKEFSITNEIEPAPTPQPDPEPAPQPDPEPAPQPEPAPTPQPAPKPVPEVKEMPQTGSKVLLVGGIAGLCLLLGVVAAQKTKGNRRK